MGDTKTTISWSLPSWCPQGSVGRRREESGRVLLAKADGTIGGQRKRETESAGNKWRETEEGSLLELIFKLDLEGLAILRIFQKLKSTK